MSPSGYKTGIRLSTYSWVRSAMSFCGGRMLGGILEPTAASNTSASAQAAAASFLQVSTESSASSCARCRATFASCSANRARTRNASARPRALAASLDAVDDRVSLEAWDAWSSGFFSMMLRFYVCVSEDCVSGRCRSACLSFIAFSLYCPPRSVYYNYGLTASQTPIMRRGSQEVTFLDV